MKPHIGVSSVPPVELRYTSQQRKRRTQNHRENLSRIKVRRGCSDCGYNDLAEALEFDHRPGEVKLFNISQAGSTAWAKVWAEIQKCDVVCANCHRGRTASRRRQLLERAGL